MKFFPTTVVMEPDGGSRRWWWRPAVLLLFALLAVVQTWPYFSGWSSTSRVRDWVQVQAAIETTQRSVLEHHQLPQWDPWRCGGVPHLADPGVDVLSPWALLQLATGPAPAIRLHVLAHLFFAMLGMWWWARRRQLPPLPALGAAVVYGLAGNFAAYTSWGYAFLLPAAYLPMLMVAHEAARERAGAAMGSGALIALMIVEGGLQVAMLGATLLLLRTLIDVAAAPRAALRPLGLLLIAMTTAVGLAAPKLVPTLLWITAYPLPTPPRDTLYLSHLIDLFLGRDTSHRVAGFRFERFEYFAYVGPLVLAAGLWSLWRCRVQPHRELAILFGLMGLLLIGSHGAWLPYDNLVKVPALRWLLWAPSRLSIVWVMLFALAFGQALAALGQRLERRRPGRLQQVVLLLLITAVAADLVVVARGYWDDHPFAADPILRQPGIFHLERGDKASQFMLQRADTGTVRCYKMQPLPVSGSLKTGVVPQAWLKDAGAGRVSVRGINANRWTLDVELQQETLILVNQNWNRGWRVRGELPASVERARDLLGIKVGAGSGRLELSYHTPGLLAGMVVCIGTVLALLLATLARRRAQRAPHASDSPF